KPNSVSTPCRSRRTATPPPVSRFYRLRGFQAFAGAGIPGRVRSGVERCVDARGLSGRFVPFRDQPTDSANDQGCAANPQKRVDARDAKFRETEIPVPSFALWIREEMGEGLRKARRGHPHPVKPAAIYAEGWTL